MSRYCQIVLGAAGSGKSSYCHIIQEHCKTIGRTVHVVNLDPAAEEFHYEPVLDIRDLISLDDAMEELKLGPNGGLVFCMEYLVDNITWLEEQLNQYNEEYLLFDCPGQIELYSHLPLMRHIGQYLTQWNYKTVVVYLQDATSLSDPTRYIAGSMNCLSAMIQMELPQINVLSKCDLIKNKDELDDLVNPDPTVLLEQLNTVTTTKQHRLNNAFCSLLEDYSLVSFIPLNPNDTDSVIYTLSHIDNAIQWGEDQEPQFKEVDEVEEDS